MQLEARVCQCGCGRQLLTKYGKPDMVRRHFDATCRNRDKLLKWRVKSEIEKQKKLAKRIREMKSIPRPQWVMIGNTPIGLATADAALALAKKYPEILDQIHVVQVGKLLRSRKCSDSKPSGASSPKPTSRAPKTRAASASSGRR